MQISMQKKIIYYLSCELHSLLTDYIRDMCSTAIRKGQGETMPSESALFLSVTRPALHSILSGVRTIKHPKHRRASQEKCS